jgi:hypothetical protein
MFISAIGIGLLSGCVVESVCFNDSDCAANKACNRSRGVCSQRCNAPPDCPPNLLCVGGICVVPCRADADCGKDERCELSSGRCKPVCPRGDTPLDCPEGMVSIANAFCIDQYEASRPDATASSSGTDKSRATSRAGVMPWSAESEQARAACLAAGKDLCTPRQWQCACQGPAATVYAYGDSYDPSACNGADKFCDCSGACAGKAPCPFAGCVHRCGAAYRLEPTGSSPRCKNGYDVFDLNGNLWEHVKGGALLVRGGAFNCSDSQTMHRCDYVPGNWTPAARGFRCCWQAEQP